VTQAGTVLPLTRCPGCWVILTEAAYSVDFGHSSPWWRAAVADSLPVCAKCSIEIETDETLLGRCINGALAWWTMNEELRRYRAAEVTPSVVNAAAVNE